MSLLLLFGSGGGGGGTPVAGNPIGLLLSLTYSDGSTPEPEPEPTPEITATPNLGVGGRAWSPRRKPLTKKQKTLLEELDEYLLELRSQISEEPEVEPEWIATLRKGEIFAEQAIKSEFTLAELQFQLRLVKEVLREMDDEDAILLAMH